MEKSMYSLILSDDVVRAVDRMAYEHRTSRSNLIDRILAEYVSLLTPDMRIRQIFDAVAQAAAANSALQILQEPSGSMLSVKSVVNYKYNPTIRYNVEIFTDGGYKAEFRVVSRSQSPSLLDRLTDFFLLWSQVEQTILAGQLPREALQHEVGGGRFCRRLAVVSDGKIYDSEVLGEAIGDYLNLFDRAMNLYFDYPPGEENKAAQPVMEAYLEFLRERELIL